MAAASGADIAHQLVNGANHYQTGQPAQRAQAVEIASDWLERF
jgi:hypothetical protein